MSARLSRVHLYYDYVLGAPSARCALDRSPARIAFGPSAACERRAEVSRAAPRWALPIGARVAEISGAGAAAAPGLAPAGRGSDRPSRPSWNSAAPLRCSACGRRGPVRSRPVLEAFIPAVPSCTPSSTHLYSERCSGALCPSVTGVGGRLLLREVTRRLSFRQRGAPPTRPPGQGVHSRGRRLQPRGLSWSAATRQGAVPGPRRARRHCRSPLPAVGTTADAGALGIPASPTSPTRASGCLALAAPPAGRLPRAASPPGRRQRRRKRPPPRRRSGFTSHRTCRRWRVRPAACTWPRWTTWCPRCFGNEGAGRRAVFMFLVFRTCGSPKDGQCRIEGG